MTKADWLETIRDIENGLAMNPTGEILERLTNRLARAKVKLAELEQKKSESQATTEKEEYREYVEAQKEWDNTPKEEKARQHKEFVTEMDKKHSRNPFLTAPQPKALTKMPAPTKPIKWANGKVYEMNELDLRRKSVDYFSDVLNGKREPKDFYRSMQFNNLVRFQIGLYRFGNEVMEHKALHPTLEMCKKETQERSEELYRQTVEYWKQYKDTDIV